MFSIYSIANQNKTAAQLLAKGGSGNLTSQNYSSQNSKNQTLSSLGYTSQNYQNSLFGQSSQSNSATSKLNNSILKQLNFQSESYSSSIAQLSSGFSMLEFGGETAKEISTSLQSLQSLALEASSTTLTENDRGELQLQAQSLSLSIETQVTTAEYDGQKVLASNTVIQIEYQSTSVGSSKLRTTNLADKLKQNGIANIDLSTVESSKESLSRITDMIKAADKTINLFNKQSKNVMKSLSAMQKGADRLDSLKSYYEKQSSQLDISYSLAQSMSKNKSQAFSAQANISASQMVSILSSRYSSLSSRSTS